MNKNTIDKKGPNSKLHNTTFDLNMGQTSMPSSTATPHNPKKSQSQWDFTENNVLKFKNVQRFKKKVIAPEEAG